MKKIIMPFGMEHATVVDVVRCSINKLVPEK